MHVLAEFVVRIGLKRVACELPQTPPLPLLYFRAAYWAQQAQHPPKPASPPMLALDARHVSRRVNRHSRSPASTTATCAAAWLGKRKVGVQSRTGTGSLAVGSSKTHAAASAACFSSDAHGHVPALNTLLQQCVLQTPATHLTQRWRTKGTVPVRCA